MKKSVYIILVFLGVQILAGIVAPIVLNFSALASHEPATVTLEESPIVMSWTLLATNLLTPLTLYAWKLFPTSSLPHRDKGIAWGILFFLACLFLTTLISDCFPLKDSLTVTFGQMRKMPIGIVTLGLVGPACEELVFRRALLGHLLDEKRLPRYAAIVLSAIVFSVIHMNPAQMLPAFLLGLALALVYACTGRLWVCIGLHILNNCLSLILMESCPDFNIYQALTSPLLLVSAIVLGVAVAAVFLTLLLRSTNGTSQSPIHDK